MATSTKGYGRGGGGGEAGAPKPLTAEQVRQAIEEIPAHRRGLREDALATLRLIERGITVKDSAPVWRQIQNVVFVSKIDVDGETDDENG